MLSSILPDKDEKDLGTFKGHFYDPDTGKNWLNGTNDTAKTNAILHFNNALNYMEEGEEFSAYESLGRCLHYIQDLCEPHHSANVTAVSLSKGHLDFEEYAYDKSDTYLNSYTSISSTYYTIANNTLIEDLAHNAAVDSKEYIDTVNDIDDQSDWDDTSRICLRSAARYSAMVLYKFAREANLTLY